MMHFPVQVSRLQRSKPELERRENSTLLYIALHGKILLSAYRKVAPGPGLNLTGGNESNLRTLSRAENGRFCPALRKYGFYPCFSPVSTPFLHTVRSTRVLSFERSWTTGTPV
jgi:hypothetical protein